MSASPRAQRGLLGIAAGVVVASTLAGCAIIAGLSDEKFSATADAGVVFVSRDAGVVIIHAGDDGAVDDGPPGAWVADTSFGNADGGGVSFDPPDSALEAPFWIAASSNAIWLVGSVVSEDFDSTGAALPDSVVAVVAIDKDAGTQVRPTYVAEAGTAGGAYASSDALYFTATYATPMAGALSGDDDGGEAGDGSTELADGGADAAVDTFVYLYKSPFDGVAASRVGAAAFDPSVTPLIDSVIPLGPRAVLRALGGTDMDAISIDFPLDGAAAATADYLDSTGFTQLTGGLAVDGGTWLTAGCAATDQECATANGGAFFVQDDGGVVEAGVDVGTGVGFGVAQSSAGKLLFGGTSADEELAFATLPAGVVSTIDTVDATVSVYVVADPSNPGGFLAVYSTGSNETQVSVLSLDSQGVPVNGTLARSNSRVIPFGDVTLQGIAVDGSHLYIATTESDAEDATTWVVRRFVYNPTAMR